MSIIQGLTLIEDNASEIGIIGSGVGYYYARSVLDTKKFSWLKLGFVYPFPREMVRKFAIKVKKIIVIEELRPYIEENIQRLGLQVLRKEPVRLRGNRRIHARQRAPSLCKFRINR